MRFSACLIFSLLIWLIIPAQGGESIRGILVYEDFPGAKPTAVPFSAITWQSAAVGSVTKIGGQTLGFSNSTVVRLIYLDEPYWKLLGDDDSLRIFRSDLHSVEVVIPMNRPNMVSASDFQAVLVGVKTLDSLQKEIPGAADILGAAEANLNRQMGWYDQGQRKVNGKWLTAEQYQASLDESASPVVKNVLTTIDGKRYENYQVSRIDPDCLHIIYTGGAASIQFTNLTKDVQETYHYDPVKAAAFVKAKEDQESAKQDEGKVDSIQQAIEETELETFLATQTPDVAESYRKLFALLETQKMTLMVVSSQLTHKGLIVSKYYPVGTSSLDPTDNTPLFIVGQFPETVDTTSFKIDIYPAGNLAQEAIDGLPAVRRFVTKKLDYVKIMDKALERSGVVRVAPASQ